MKPKPRPALIRSDGKLLEQMLLEAVTAPGTQALESLAQRLEKVQARRARIKLLTRR